jgi:protoporphyrinogen oxidase
MTETEDVVVIGAGITGMTIADIMAALGRRVIVISPDVGGLISNTFSRGYKFDIGGHVYTPNDPDVVQLMEESGGVRHERKAFYVGGDGELIQYPVQSSAEQLGIELTGTGDGKYRGESLEQWAISVFGLQFYESWYRAFNRRVWSTDPSQMDSDWVAGRVQRPSEQKQGWGPNAKFIYAPGDQIIRTLQLRASKQDITFLSHKVAHVDIAQHLLHTEAGATVHYAKLFDTTRLFTAPYGRANRIATVGVGLDHMIDADFNWVYTNLGVSAHRVTLLSRYHPSNAPEGKDSVIVEYPYASMSDLPGFLQKTTMLTNHHAMAWLDREAAADAVSSLGIKELAHVGTDQVATAVVMDAIGYPVPTRGIRRVISELKSFLQNYDVYLAGRWGSHGYFNLDHCYSDARAAVGFACFGGPDDGEEYFRSSFYYAQA